LLGSERVVEEREGEAGVEGAGAGRGQREGDVSGECGRVCFRETPRISDTGVESDGE
jgi:hypothetical protein